MNILVADLGGTKACLAWADESLHLTSVSEYLTHNYSGFYAILDTFLKSSIKRPDVISVGIAGSVLSSTVHMPNLGWTIDRLDLQKTYGAKVVFFLNDLEAFAWGVDTGGKFSVLKEGVAALGNKAVIAAGTGLGMAIIHRVNDQEIPFSTEGGHCSFAPRLGDEKLVEFISSKCEGHASWERVVSGKFGFSNLLEFLKNSFEKSQYDVFRKIDPENVGPMIVDQARSGNPLALGVMERFCYYYGAESANLALKSFAVSGVYVGGGIAKKIKDFLIEKPWFREGFLNKGRYREFLMPIPVYLLEDEQAALKGAAKRALTDKMF
jgi:glucokinase